MNDKAADKDDEKRDEVLRRMLGTKPPSAKPPKKDKPASEPGFFYGDSDGSQRARLRCLELAIKLGATSASVVSLADELFAFIVQSVAVAAGSVYAICIQVENVFSICVVGGTLVCRDPAFSL